MFVSDLSIEIIHLGISISWALYSVFSSRNRCPFDCLGPWRKQYIQRSFNSITYLKALSSYIWKLCALVRFGRFLKRSSTFCALLGNYSTYCCSANLFCWLNRYYDSIVLCDYNHEFEEWSSLFFVTGLLRDWILLIEMLVIWFT